MILEVISPSEILYKGTVDSVNLPGVLGGFSVLKNHAPLISELKEGMLRYFINGDETSIAIKGGIADVHNNKISVCVY